ncbi:MAG: glycosyltransferase family 2 protein [Pikeienuella sp.]
MKNEGPYILEWLAYHRVIGFSNFLIYTNDCADGTTEILDRLTHLGVVQHEENIVLRRGPHKSALKYAKDHHLARSSAWIYVADIDEYLNIHIGQGTVQELMQAYPNADAIPVTWRLFSHNDHVELVKPDLLQDFTDAERALENGGQDGRFVKTLFRNDPCVERYGLHTPIVGKDHVNDFVWITPDGRKLADPDSKSRGQFGYVGAQVNHYAVRTVEGYLVKKDRGRANHFRHNLGTDYWQRMCRGGETDLSIQRHIPAVRAEMQKLLEDKLLAKLHAESLAWHKDKVNELRKIPDFADLRRDVIALSNARDHQRTEVDRAMHQDQKVTQNALRAQTQRTAADTEASSPKTIKSIILSLRHALQGIEPLEANLTAADLINKLEKICDDHV